MFRLLSLASFREYQYAKTYSIVIQLHHMQIVNYVMAVDN